MSTQFKIGDTVQFMVVKVRGSGFDLSTQEGKIVRFSEPDGLKALIKKRNGKEDWKPVSKLRSLAQNSPVDDVFKSLTS